MEEEKRQLHSLNRFVVKHAPTPEGPASAPVSASSSSSSSGATAQRHHTTTAGSGSGSVTQRPSSSSGRGSGSSPIPTRVHRQTQANALATAKQYPFSLANHSQSNEPPSSTSQPQQSQSQSHQSQSTSMSYSNSVQSVRRKSPVTSSSSSSSSGRKKDDLSYSQKEKEGRDRDVNTSQGLQYVGVVMNGLAGNAEAPYIRWEETDVASPGLEAALTVMHDSIIRINPTLLPVFRKLSNEIYVERTRMVQRHSQLIGQLSIVQPKGKMATGGGGGSVQLMQHKRWLSPAMRDRSSPISTSPTFLTRARTHTPSARPNSSHTTSTTNTFNHPTMHNNSNTSSIGIGNIADTIPAPPAATMASSTLRESTDPLLGSVSMAHPYPPTDLASSQAYSGIFSDLAPSSASSHHNNQSAHSYSYTQSYLQQQTQ